MERPEYVEDEHLEYLDELREIGTTNMFGARPYVIAEFGMAKDEADGVLSYWMNTFGNDDR